MSGREELAKKTSLFRELHRRSTMLVLPNAWDPVSARAFERVGFAAIATTSGGVAAVLGHEDHERAPADEMLAAVARICRAVSVPVSADIEGGYGMGAAELAGRVIAAGAVGANIEDTDHRSGGLVDADEHAVRLAAFRSAAHEAGVELVLNARVDVFLHAGDALPDRLAEGIRRARLYVASGAESVYPLGIAGDEAIAAFVRAVDVPVNVLATDATELAHLAALGVRRVTFATRLARRAFAMIDELAAELHAQASVVLNT